MGLTGGGQAGTREKPLEGGGRTGKGTNMEPGARSSCHLPKPGIVGAMSCGKESKRGGDRLVEKGKLQTGKSKRYPPGVAERCYLLQNPPARRSKKGSGRRNQENVGVTGVPEKYVLTVKRKGPLRESRLGGAETIPLVGGGGEKRC